MWYRHLGGSDAHCLPTLAGAHIAPHYQCVRLKLMSVRSQATPELTSPIVILGAQGSGKTLLSRRLAQLQKTGEHDSPIDADVVPSIGVDISNLPVDKNKAVQIKEVGGAMMPLWPTYLKGAAALIYVVDVSDAFQLAASATAFHHLCGLPAMSDKRVLLLWNKTDAPCTLDEAEVAGFDAARAQIALGDALTTMRASALDGSNAQQVMAWMRGVYGL